MALDAHVVGRRGTGNETYVLSLIQALAGHPGVRPVALLEGRPPWPNGAIAESYALRTRHRTMRILFELPIAARRVRADVLHVQYVAPPIAGVPIVAAVHDLSFEDVPGVHPRAMETRLRASTRAIVRQASAIVAVSEFTRSRLIDRYRLDPTRVFVTPIAVDAFWRPSDPDERARALGRCGIRGPFILAVGNVERRKNLDVLIRSIAQLRACGFPDLGLVVVGQRRPRERHLDEAIDRHGAGSWVTQTGFVDRSTLRSLYGAAQAVAYVSLYEGFGLPVLEAMACGAIVVASATTAIPEAAGPAAVLVDPTRPDAVAEGLVRVLSDERLRADLAVAGPTHARTFTMDRFATATMDAYRAALGRE